MGRPGPGWLALLLCGLLVADASGKRPASKADKLIEQIESLLPSIQAGSEQEDPRVRSLRQVLADPDPDSEEKEATSDERNRSKERFRSRSLEGPRAEAGEGRFPLPSEVCYQFGSRQPVLLAEKNARLKAVLKKGQAPGVRDLDPDHRLEWLTHGCLPESELQLFAIQARLDVQTGGDRLALFLDAWRNRGPHGDESFYEALDRTAGTPDEVFFFDAMLGDFVNTFAGQAGKRWYRQVQHDRLQQAFLSYRQYRGLIEAASYSVVLPPDISFPARLSRYDYGSVGEGQLSLRHQIDLLVEMQEGDVIAALDRIRDFLQQHPLPEKLWDPYDPLPDLWALVRVDLFRLVDRRTLSTEKIWQAQRDGRLCLANEIREACRQGATH